MPARRLPRKNPRNHKSWKNGSGVARIAPLIFFCAFFGACCRPLSSTGRDIRRAGRVAEGAPLLRVYGLTPIEGSNPSLSAIREQGTPTPRLRICGIEADSNPRFLKSRVRPRSSGDRREPIPRSPPYANKEHRPCGCGPVESKRIRTLDSKRAGFDREAVATGGSQSLALRHTRIRNTDPAAADLLNRSGFEPSIQKEPGSTAKQWRPEGTNPSLSAMLH